MVVVTIAQSSVLCVENISINIGPATKAVMVIPKLVLERLATKSAMAEAAMKNQKILSPQFRREIKNGAQTNSENIIAKPREFL
jgi:hypothetical protein